MAIGAASLQEWLGLSIKDAAFSAVWLSLVEFGMGFLHQLGLMDLIDLLELSKGLSKIGAKLFELMWLNLRKTNFPLSAFSFHKHVRLSNMSHTPAQLLQLLRTSLVYQKK